MDGLKTLRLVLLKQIGEDENLQRQWNALVERSGDPQVFYTYEWALAVQHAYSDSLNPLICLAYDGQDALCGVVALAKSVAQDHVSFLCATTGDYCDFLSAPEDRPVFVASVLSELKRQGIKNVVLTNLPADSGTVAEIREAARQQGYFCFARTAYECARVLIDRLGKGKDGKPIAPGLSRISRFAKKIGRQIPIQFDHNRCWDAVQPIVPQFIKAHVARFLEVGRISNYAHASRKAFLEKLSKLLSDAQWLVLSRMTVGGRPVAWQYGFQFGGSWFLYQPTFDSTYEKHWPGFCLLTHVIKEATENPALTTVDLGLGAEVYKAKFANGSRETLYVTLHSSLLEHLREVLRYRAAAAVRAFPQLEKFAESLRTKFRFFRDRLRKDGAQGTLAWAASRVRRLFWAEDEIFFYELVRSQPTFEANALSLSPIDLDLLATSAMQYSDDEGTLAYLLRCAKRLNVKEYAGFALVNGDGEAVHFTWAGPFDGFHWSELNCTLPSPSPDAMVLFDSWTPVSQRGRGYYAPTLVLVAERIQQQGKKAWGFSAATNRSSIRGLEKMGFPRRFSMVRRKFLWWQRLSRHGTGSTMKTEMPVAC